VNIIILSVEWKYVLGELNIDSVGEETGSNESRL